MGDFDVSWEYGQQNRTPVACCSKPNPQAGRQGARTSGSKQEVVLLVLQYS